MRAEKVILSFLGVFIGLIVAGGAFYIYQSTKTVSPNSIKNITATNATPTPSSSVFLVVDNPTDESVTDTKVISITGKTIPTATLLVSTPTTDTVVTPSATGAFSLTVNLSDDENKIYLTAIAPDGQEAQKIITVTYSTEDF